MIKTRIGDLDIIETGSLVSPNNEIIQISFGVGNDFTVEMQLTNSDSNEETKLEAYEIQEVGLGLRFLNFKNTLGTGNLSPIRLGWFQGRSMFLNYRIFPINSEQGAIIHYTFLLGKNVDQDGNELD